MKPKKLKTKTTESINKTKFVFKKKNQNSRQNNMKKKREEKNTNIRKERRDITADPQEIKGIISGIV